MGDSWRSLGYNEFNRKIDKEINAVIMFATVSLGFVVLSVIWTYTPDRGLQDWSTREVRYGTVPVPTLFIFLFLVFLG